MPALRGLTKEPLPDVHARMVGTGFSGGFSGGPAVIGRAGLKSVRDSKPDVRDVNLQRGA